MGANDLKTIKLIDGRKLAWLEFGKPDGKPCLYIHGFPTCRLEGGIAAQIAAELGIRLIAPDRPGYGASDYCEQRKIGDWTNDVCALLDYLEISDLSAVAVSGGGPYGCACAALIPDRISKLALVCALGVPDKADGLQKMHFTSRTALNLAARRPAFFGFLFRSTVIKVLKHRPEIAIKLLSGNCPRVDKDMLARPEVGGTLIKAFRESVRQCPNGTLSDLILYASPWEFDISKINIPVHIWHGEADTVIPISFSKYLAKTIPNSTTRFLPKEGHFSLAVGSAKEVLTELMG